MLKTLTARLTLSNAAVRTLVLYGPEALLTLSEALKLLRLKFYKQRDSTSVCRQAPIQNTKKF